MNITVLFYEKLVRTTGEREGIVAGGRMPVLLSGSRGSAKNR